MVRRMLVPMLAIIWVASGHVADVYAQNTALRNNKLNEKKIQWMVGLTYYSHNILAEDEVFPVKFGQRKAFPGVRIALIRNITSDKAFVYDLDLEFGNMERYFYGHDYVSGLLGFQFFLGPRWRIKSSRVHFHSMGGLSYLWIGGGEGYTPSQRINIQWYGVTGYEKLLAEYYNNLN